MAGVCRRLLGTEWLPLRVTSVCRDHGWQPKGSCPPLSSFSTLENSRGRNNWLWITDFHMKQGDPQPPFPRISTVPVLSESDDLCLHENFFFCIVNSKIRQTDEFGWAYQLLKTVSRIPASPPSASHGMKMICCRFGNGSKDQIK
ncbi:hypothetical protein PABG_04820 [Paracoccidioides brasiliensis Pb03]|nr:hypothetical protein PABG_04820 [Paracoccidioides brasiliensis Pb03]